jgi:hypothetical protein
MIFNDHLQDFVQYKVILKMVKDVVQSDVSSEDI